uniref:Uncharacterized protein n=1 Tax=Globisporangium ultimum (strain ATCC 200006 / CBS 805.95 / DAOM BR144) TaxID=431595 RepID=K3WIM1_GLOUD
MLQQLHRAPAQLLAPPIAMLAAPAAAPVVDNIDSDVNSTKCRYKTGKCTNARSSKRNGQPHQLCLYHRDKANQIQRKFDRQKRQVLRERKTSTTSRTANAASGLHLSHLNVHHFFPATPRFRSSSSAKELDLYSDSDSSRFSTDSSSSDSSVASVLDQVWQDLPLSPTAMMALRLTPTAAATAMTSPTPVSPPSHGLSPTTTQGHLSHDEIDFLCSAMLE